MNGLVIERDIPPPARKPHRFWHRLLQSLQPGDSTLIDRCADRDAVRKAASALGIPIATAKIHGRGVRIWRLEA